MKKDQAEREFIQRLGENADSYFLSVDNSVMEGFQYFKTSEYKNKPGAIKSRPKELFAHQSLSSMFKLGTTMVKLLPQIMGNIQESFEDVNYLFDDQVENETTPLSILESYPNTSLFDELKEYAWSKHKVVLGFTKVPSEYIFSGKGIPYPYALVLAQEMSKTEIEQSPNIEAGIEVMKVYNSLGIAANDIARWLRRHYRIACMANHPLGGLVDTVPLGMKAGLGFIGRNGLLITESFGPRCRITPIFIDEQIFETTQTHRHDWIADLCAKCGACQRACPKNAIYDESVETRIFDNSEIPNRRESYDREKCFKVFAATMGCGLCIKACPFSKNPKSYGKMKEKLLGKG